MTVRKIAQAAFDASPGFVAPAPVRFSLRCEPHAALSPDLHRTLMAYAKNTPSQRIGVNMKNRFELKLKDTNGRYRLATQDEIVSTAKGIVYAELESKPALTSSNSVIDYLKHAYHGLEYESFGVIFLNNRHEVIAFEQMFRGTIDRANVYPREIVKTALNYNAAALILAHNHPSQNPEPSRSDIQITETLKTALALFDIRIIDHIVIGHPKSVSLADRGLL